MQNFILLFLGFGLVVLVVSICVLGSDFTDLIKIKGVFDLITDGILKIFFVFGRGLIHFFPGFHTIPSWADSTLELLNIALFFFPVDLWAVILAAVLF